MGELNSLSRSTAEILLALFQQQSADLNAQVWTFLEELEEDEYRESRLLIAFVMGENFLTGMRPILKRHPEIVPEELKGMKFGLDVYECDDGKSMMDRLQFISRPTADVLLKLFLKQCAELSAKLQEFRASLEHDEFQSVQLLIERLRNSIHREGLMPLFDRYREIRLVG